MSAANTATLTHDLSGANQADKGSEIGAWIQYPFRLTISL